ncbi:Sulfur carrier protein adenylyltransferase ThiF [Clostridiaceae bacterium JG1575]|nr:Sulfur carrier protein adenylyltransferase ThiF [Clostridiaceae bacterium JG1575]
MSAAVNDCDALASLFNTPFYQGLLQRIPRKAASRLARSRVLIVGLGGLGSHIALSLVRSGVRILYLADSDRVDETNLHRQSYGWAAVGKLKTQALSQELLALNPDCDLTLCPSVTPRALEGLLDRVDLIIEAVDEAKTKAWIAQTILSQEGPPLISASGMAGLSSFNQLRVHQKGPRWILCGDGVSHLSPNAALYAPRVQACAAAQALCALQLLLGLPVDAPTQDPNEFMQGGPCHEPNNPHPRQ